MVRDSAFEEEKKKVDADRADLIQFLSHDTSSTRRRLIGVLRERIEVLETEIDTDLISSRLG